MDLALKNKVALVAGASQGLGYAIALALAREGARVAICSRDVQRIEAAAKQIHAETGVTVLPIAADLTQHDDIARCVERVITEWNTIHITVTNAGGSPSRRFMEVTPEEWQQAINLTLMSVITLSKNVIPHMQKQQWGRLIHLCSGSVRNPIPNLVLSNSLRAAVVALSKTQANELAADDILVNSILTGWIKTSRTDELLKARAVREGISSEQAYATREAFIPLKRIGRPEELADVVTFLASERASFLTGTAVTVDGGETPYPF
jgi:3-oxoacyl-[acyl-carrier protein] reductase